MNKVSSDGNGAQTSTIASRKAQGILVLGMHRSGTSACTRVLNMLGCALSDQLIGIGEGNENGHWEAIEAVQLNDEMLASAGSSHDDWGPISPEWRQSALRDQMVERASVVVSDHAQLGPLFAIKDPRMCRLGDVWIEAAIAADVNPLVLVMLRNPLEVVDSLEARDLMATGYAELLWLRHVLDAEHFSRGSTRVFLRYDQLLSNWQSLIIKCKKGLGVALPRNSPKVHSEISQFLSQSHRHHHADPAMALNDPTRSQWLRETFGIMLRWSESGEDAADYPALDEMRAELDRSYGVFARLLLSQDMTGVVASGKRLRDQISQLQQESAHYAEALRIATETAEGERSAAQHREAELAAAIHQAEADLAKAHAEIAAQQESRRETDQRHAEALRIATETAEGERSAAQHREAELAAAIHQAEADLAKAHAEIAAQQESRREADQRHAEALSAIQNEHVRNAELNGQLVSLQSAMLQRQEELAQLLTQLREAEVLRLRAEAGAERERERRLSLEQAITAANVQIAALQQQMTRAQTAAEQQADAHSADLAQLTLLLKAQEEAAEQAAAEASEGRAEAQRLWQQVEQLANAANEAEAAQECSLAEVQRLSQLVAELTSAANQAEDARTASERKLAARFDELARLTTILSEESRRANASDAQSQWLCNARRLEESFPAWWSIMPAAWRQRRIHQRYWRAGLFDAAGYLALYPDVATEGMDPIRHYILHGMAEGRARPVPS